MPHILVDLFLGDINIGIGLDYSRNAKFINVCFCNYHFLNSAILHNKEFCCMESEKHRIGKLFEVCGVSPNSGYEPQKHEKISSFTVNCDKKPQDIRIMLTSETELFVRFIHPSFEGEGNKPDMQQLYDWNDPRYKDPNFEDPRVNRVRYDDGSWHWDYPNSILKNKGQHIRLGIKFLAVSPFIGKLKVHITCEGEGNKKDYYFPFMVINPNNNT